MRLCLFAEDSIMNNLWKFMFENKRINRINPDSVKSVVIDVTAGKKVNRRGRCGLRRFALCICPALLR